MLGKRAHRSTKNTLPKCLLVDDLEENLLSLEAMLENEPVTTYKAGSAAEALELILKHDFALALLDVQMPDMNGLELANLMRGCERSKYIPIIFVTASRSNRSFEGYEAGAVDFLFKPLEIPIVKSKVRVFLDLFHQRQLLLDHEERYRSSFENVAVGLARLSPAGQWLQVNPEYSRVLGRTQDELLGMSIQDVIHPEDLDTFWNSQKRALRGELKTDKQELRHIHKNGSSIWVSLTLSAISSCMDTREFIVSARDISFEKRASEALVQAKDAADVAARTKAEFLANMSHEIRTPMTAIMGFSDLLLTDKFSKQDTNELLSRIKSNGTALLQLIDDILDLSKFENGRVPIEQIPFSPGDLVDEVLAALRPLAEKKGIELRWRTTADLPLSIQSDPLRLRQVLTNLISNGIKFTKAGFVEVSLEYSANSKDSLLNFSVEDTGIGMSEEQRNQLFKPFSQADSTISRKYGGTGLGLALSLKIAEALGGSLELEWSKPEKGSRFTGSIKVRAGDAIVDTRDSATVAKRFIAMQARRLHGLKILVADDSPDNQMIVGHYLKKEGASTVVADDGNDALREASKQSFDVVLMDVQMPKLNGLDATQQLRNNGFTTPIIAFTAHALKEEVEKCLSAGCDAHIAKPIRRDELVESILAVLDRAKEGNRDDDSTVN